MGYLDSATVRAENKELEAYAVTQSDLDAWARTKSWLGKFIGCRGGGGA